MTQMEWICFGETGISSKTMWAAINGAATKEQNNRKGFIFDVPHDPSDFKRCYDYVLITKTTKEQLEIVKNVFNWFAPFIDNWHKIVEIYEIEKNGGNRGKGNTYKYIQELEEQSMALDGWIRTDQNTWKRSN